MSVRPPLPRSLARSAPSAPAPATPAVNGRSDDSGGGAMGGLGGRGGGGRGGGPVVRGHSASKKQFPRRRLRPLALPARCERLRPSVRPENVVRSHLEA